jgi:hypothetical protein
MLRIEEERELPQQGNLLMPRMLRLNIELSLWRKTGLIGAMRKLQLGRKLLQK